MNLRVLVVRMTDVAAAVEAGTDETDASSAADDYYLEITPMPG